MPILSNARHERFCQEIVKGKSQMEAYKLAGYSAETAKANANRLMENYGIKERIAELQERAIRRVEINVETLTEMYIDTYKAATELKQPAAARGCLDSLGKLHGILIERKESGGPGDFARMTDDELDRFIAERERTIRGGETGEGDPSFEDGVRGTSH